MCSQNERLLFRYKTSCNYRKFIRNKKGQGNHSKRQKTLLINHLKAIINVIHEQKIKKLIKFRDKSIMLIGFGGGFRRSELISIDFEDLEFVSEGLKINLKRSKTDQFGEGMIKGIPFFDNENYCPVKNLNKWLHLSNIKKSDI